MIHCRGRRAEPSRRPARRASSPPATRAVRVGATLVGAVLVAVVLVAVGPGPATVGPGPAAAAPQPGGPANDYVRLLDEGLIQRQSGNYQAAAARFAEAARRFPDKGGGHFFLGQLHALRGRCGDALPPLRRFLAIGRPARRVAEARRLVATCEERLAREPTARTGPPVRLRTGVDASVAVAVDGHLDGAALVLGGGHRWRRLALDLSVVVGPTVGLLGGIRLHALPGRVRPTLSIRAAVFFADGVHPGAHLGLGAEVDATTRIGAFVEGAVEQFTSLPEPYQSRLYIAQAGVRITR